MPTRFVMLLRGVNVGGHNRLPMKALIGALEEAGATQVRTLLQSGNAVFSVQAARAERSAAAAMRLLVKSVGFEPRFTLRSAAEFGRTARTHPCDAPKRDPSSLHVGFLAARPTAPAVRTLESMSFANESFFIRGREIFVHYGAGAARTKLTVDLVDRTLGTHCTMRNWNTVRAVKELLHASE